MAGLKTIISLSFVLASGFLLAILSGALFNNNWSPLFVVAIFVFAPVPNWIFSKCVSSSDNYYSDDNASNGCKDFGKFITSWFIVSGLYLPIVLIHAGTIGIPEMVMSIGGGALIYATIITFCHCFAPETNEIY